MKKRTELTQLYTAEDLDRLFKKETKRIPPKEKINTHYPQFGIVKKWLQYLRIDTDLFIKTYKKSDLIREGERVRKLVISRTLKEGLPRSLCFEISDYLSESDSKEKADFIFVFGGEDTERIEKAISLWKQNWAEKIVITGGNPQWNEKRFPEAVRFSRIAILKGIPKDRLLIEPNSYSMIDNIKTILNIFDIWGITFKKIIIVAPWYALRRAWCYWMKHCKHKTKIMRIQSSQSSIRPQKSNWVKNEEGISYIFLEFIKMKVAIDVFNDS